MKLPFKEIEKLRHEDHFSISTSYEDKYTFCVETDDISFIPLEIIKRRRIKSLGVLEKCANSAEIISALLGSPLKENKLTKKEVELMNKLQNKLEENIPCESNVASSTLEAAGKKESRRTKIHQKSFFIH